MVLLKTLLLIVLLIERSQAQLISEQSLTKSCEIQFDYGYFNKQTVFVQCTPLNSNTSAPITQWTICEPLCCAINQTQTETNVRPCLVSQTSIKLYSLKISIIIGTITLIAVSIIGFMTYQLIRFCISKEQTPLLNEGEQLDFTRALNQIKWLSRKETTPQLQTNTPNMQQLNLCKLCLNSKTQLESQCGHHYHTPCLQHWLEYHKKCPECPKPVQYLRVHCSCQQQYFLMTVPHLRMYGNFTAKCPHCLEKQQIEIKITHKFWLEQEDTSNQPDIKSHPSCQELVNP